MSRQFRGPESEYRHFMETPPPGFILNAPKAPGESRADWYKIHRTDCRHAGAYGAVPQQGTWTDGEMFKVFAGSWDEIVEAYTKFSNPRNRQPVSEVLCEFCNPSPG